MHTDINGLAFVFMTLASTVACTIAYWAGKQAADR
jgi:membrane protein DedA with SNARE-associated domain